MSYHVSPFSKPHPMILYHCSSGTMSQLTLHCLLTACACMSLACMCISVSGHWESFGVTWSYLHAVGISSIHLNSSSKVTLTGYWSLRWVACQCMWYYLVARVFLYFASLNVTATWPRKKLHCQLGLPLTCLVAHWAGSELLWAGKSHLELGKT